MRLTAPLLLSLLLPLSLQAAAPAAECSALQAEVETLRAKVLALEGALLPAPSAAAQTADTALPGTAAKPEAVKKLVIEEPYSRTGCSRGLFKGIEPARWQEPDLWLELEKGQSPAQVEKLLGIEHYDERGGGNIVWHYGKCGASSMAQVLFKQGRLADWRAPAQR